MNQLVNSALLAMSSREIAEITEKRHPDVKRDIEKMFEQLNEDVSKNARNYQDALNRQQTEYILDREHAECLVTGYSAVLRMKVIKRLRELEISSSQPKIPQSFAEALRLAADQAEKIAVMEPKAEVFDRIVERTNLLNATQVGQPIGMSAVKLNQRLTELDVYNRTIKRGKAFQQWFVDAGYGEMTQTEMGYPQALFTTAGQAWVVQKLVSEGII